MNDEHRELSETQQRVLALLPIASALLSVFGSTIIILMAFKSRQTKPWTPYHGLLTAMSTCDIISSVTLAMGWFMHSQETSSKIWIVGNAKTCTATGFMNQFAISGVLYNAFLSVYFLLSVRFRFHDEYIASKYEPAMHYFCLGYGLISAFVGLFKDAYGERQTSIGCWVDYCNNPGPNEGEDCRPTLVGGWLGRYPMILAFTILVTCNVLILIQLKSELVTSGQQSSTGTENDDDDSDRSMSSQRNLPDLSQLSNERKEQIQQAMRKQQLRLMSTQAFLYVGAYILCAFPTFALRWGVSGSYELGSEDGWVSLEQETAIPSEFYSLMVLQAIFLPLQGLSNMLVYVRPNYIVARQRHLLEGRYWAFRRAIFGSTIDPTFPREECQRGG